MKAEGGAVSIAAGPERCQGLFLQSSHMRNDSFLIGMKQVELKIHEITSSVLGL